MYCIAKRFTSLAEGELPLDDIEDWKIEQDTLDKFLYHTEVIPLIILARPLQYNSARFRKKGHGQNAWTKECTKCEHKNVQSTQEVRR